MAATPPFLSSRLDYWLDPGDTNQITLDGTYFEPVYGCIDPIACNYDASANTDDGSCESLSCAVTLSFREVDSNSFEILMNNPLPVSVFQFTITDDPDAIDVVDVILGSAVENDFTIITTNDGLIIGYSLSEEIPPAGELDEVLIEVKYSVKDEATEETLTTLCITEAFVAGTDLNEFLLIVDDCMTIELYTPG